MLDYQIPSSDKNFESKMKLIFNYEIKSLFHPIMCIDVSKQNDILILGSLNDFLILSKKDENEEAFNETKYKLNCQFTKCAKFTNQKSQILFGTIKEYKIIQYSLTKKNIEFIFIIENYKQIDISLIQFNPNVNKSNFLVSSTDNCLRLWDLITKNCLICISNNNAFCFEKNGNWFFSIKYDKNYKNNSISIYITEQDIILKKNPDNIQIGCFNLLDESEIIDVYITNNHMYCITLNNEGEISIYYMWNMKKYKTFNCIIDVGISSKKLFIFENIIKDECFIVYFNNKKQFKVANIFSNADVIIDKNFEDDNQQNTNKNFLFASAKNNNYNYMIISNGLYLNKYYFNS